MRTGVVNRVEAALEFSDSDRLASDDDLHKLPFRKSILVKHDLETLRGSDILWRLKTQRHQIQMKWSSRMRL